MRSTRTTESGWAPPSVAATATTARVASARCSPRTTAMAESVCSDEPRARSAGASEVLTAYDGDFRTAVQLRAARPQRGRTRDAIPAGLALRQQWRALVQLPVKRVL